MSQSLVCGDIDGDGFADVLAGGQNAGPDLTGGGSQGMVAFFKGSADGLGKNESWTLLPEVEEKAQYFGSSMILEDINGDEIQDLIVSGWGLKETEESDNTGGVYIYHGGTDWQNGPTQKVFGKKGSQFGSVIKLVKIGNQKLLGVIAPNEDKNGTIYFYDPATMTEKFTVKVPSTLNMGEWEVSAILIPSGIQMATLSLLLVENILRTAEEYSVQKLLLIVLKNWLNVHGSLKQHQADSDFQLKMSDNIDSNGEKDEIVVGMPEYIQTVTD
jgi:hypothetical protein